MHLKMLSVATAAVAQGADCCTEKSALYRGTTGAEVPPQFQQFSQGTYTDIHHDWGFPATKMAVFSWG